MANESATKALYDRDLVAWLDEQAALLRSGQLDEVDAAHIADELEAMSRSQQRELQNRMAVLLAHLLKCDHQPELHSRSWDATIAEQQRQIRSLLTDSPSLRGKLESIAIRAYLDAREKAAIETGLPIEVFPAAPSTPLETLLGLTE